MTNDYLDAIERGLDRWHMVSSYVVQQLIAEIRRQKLEIAELKSNGAIKILRVKEADRD